MMDKVILQLLLICSAHSHVDIGITASSSSSFYASRDPLSLYGIKFDDGFEQCAAVRDSESVKDYIARKNAEQAKSLEAAIERDKLTLKVDASVLGIHGK